MALEVNLFLFAVGARDRASSRLRVWDHVDWLRDRGMTVRIDSLVPVGAKCLSPALLARVIRRLPGWVVAFLRADAVVLQESLLLWPLLLVRNLGKRRRVVFDFSDPVDRHGAGWKGQLRQWAFSLIVRHADVVMVENKAYLSLLQGDARALLHVYGPVDAARYARERAALPVPSRVAVRIGWTGSPGTYRFIAPLMPIIDAIARDYPIEVVLIGSGPIDHIFRHASLTLMDWNEDVEFSTVPSFDLGLFRLENSLDALWRGAGKLFIYIAAGVPFVANDRGIAHDLMAETDVAFRVPYETDWAAVLTRAVTAADQRHRMVAASLDYAPTLSYDAYRTALMKALVTPRRGQA